VASELISHMDAEDINLLFHTSLESESVSIVTIG
jgi:hypothetical protein